MLTRFPFWISIVTFATLSCARTDSTSGGAPINSTIYAQGVCSHLVKCGRAFVREHFETTDACVKAYEKEAARLFALQGIRVGRAEVNACAVEIDRAACDVDVQTIAACDFKGVFLEGQGCTTGAQCASGSCFHAQEGACGSCTVRAADGDSCEAAACAPSLVCDAQSKVCRAPPKPPAQGAGPEERCDSTTTLCNGAQGLVCENGTCRERIATLDSSCAATPFCERSFCVPGAKICRAHVREGQACGGGSAATSECAFPLRCIGGVCALTAACP